MEKLLEWPVNSAELGKGLRYIPRPSPRLNLARHGVDEEGDEDDLRVVWLTGGAEYEVIYKYMSIYIYIYMYIYIYI